METKQNPLVPLFETRGASTGAPLGITTALDFGDAVAEHLAVRERAGVIDLAHLGAMRVTGDDGTAFLQRMVTSDVGALEPGASQPSAFLTAKGKFVAVFDLVRGEEDYLAVTPRADLDALRADLTKYAILDEVAFADESDAFAVLHVAGPERERLVESIEDGGVTSISRARTGEPGVDLLVPRDRAAAVWTSLVGAGCAPVGHVAHETLRIEAGIPRPGAELTGDIGPLEADMPELVSLTKGCYRGQEVVAKMHYIGKPPKRIVGLGIDTPDDIGDESDPDPNALPATGDAIVSDGKNVGRVTSAAFGPTIGRRVALGLVRAKIVEEGAPVTCETETGIVLMRFEETPFR